mmetsp:Transcript_23180/g.54715  ORF Transcript_23180/g.54715 Transcript_23180/m.54715 type:complete len:255 (-) Transcript_23180:252-1016(-)
MLAGTVICWLPLAPPVSKESMKLYRSWAIFCATMGRLSGAREPKREREFVVCGDVDVHVDDASPEPMPSAVRFRTTSSGSMDIPMLSFTGWFGDNPRNSSRSDQPVRKISDCFSSSVRHPSSSKPDCTVGLSSTCQYTKTPEFGGIALAAPGSKKNTSSLMAVRGEGRYPGLSTVSVNFVLLDPSTGRKSVRSGAVAAINPNIGPCCARNCCWCCWCSCAAAAAEKAAKPLLYDDMDESRSKSMVRFVCTGRFR